jgi:ABC-2 type transport system ATP-binding protein
MQQTFYQMVEEIKAEGRTVFMSSHNLAEVQAICDRVAILRSGQLQAVENVQQLRHRDFQWVNVYFREPFSVSRLANIPGISDVMVDNNRLRLRLTGDFDPLLRVIGEQYVVDVTTEKPTLEEVFLTYYSEQQTNDSAVKEAVL